MASPPPILTSVRSNQVFSWSAVFVRPDDSVLFDFPWSSCWQPHLRGVERAVQTNCPLCHRVNPTLQDWRRRNLSGRVGKRLIPGPSPLGSRSEFQFPFQKRVIIVWAQVFLSALSIGSRETGKGKADSILCWGSCKPPENYAVCRWVCFVPGITCWRGCVCTAGLALFTFRLSVGVVPGQGLLKALLTLWSGSRMFSKGCKLTYQEILPLVVTLPQPYYSVLNLSSNTSHG